MPQITVLTLPWGLKGFLGVIKWPKISISYINISILTICIFLCIIYKCSKAHSVKGEQICCGMGVKMGAARFYTHSAADLQGVGESLFN